MSRATIEPLIARLDALSRERELTPGESKQLQKLISTERRYDSFKTARAPAPVPAKDLVDDELHAMLATIKIVEPSND